jgi:hypothetical protein
MHVSLVFLATRLRLKIALNVQWGIFQMDGTLPNVLGVNKENT